MSVNLAIPFAWTTPREALTGAGMPGLLHRLLEDGLKDVPADRHYSFLTHYHSQKAPMGFDKSLRPIVKVKLSQPLSMFWINLVNELRPHFNRIMIDRLALSIIAKETALLYDIPESQLISFGFLSPGVVKLIQRPPKFMVSEERAVTNTTPPTTEYSGPMLRVQRMSDKKARLLARDFENLEPSHPSPDGPGASERIQAAIDRSWSLLVELGLR